MLNSYRHYNSEGRKKTALKNSPSLKTNVLYVGKVEKNLGKRLATHFGYAGSSTGGLQLKHWARDIKLELTLTLIIFDDKLNSFLNPLEIEMGRLLNPMLGKSRT